MAQLPMMPLWTDAWVADTQHLTMEEVGAYLSLLICMWRNNGRPLEQNDRDFARICRVSPKRWNKRLWPRLSQFFDVRDGCLHQKRLERELENVTFLRQKRAKSGAIGGVKNAQKKRESTGLTLLINNETGVASAIAKSKQNGSKQGSKIVAPIPIEEESTVTFIESGVDSSSAEPGVFGAQPERDQGVARLASVLGARSARTPVPALRQAQDDPADPAETVPTSTDEIIARITGAWRHPTPDPNDPVVAEQLKIDRLFRFAMARFQPAVAQRAVMGLMGEDPDREAAWWHDHLARAMTADGWIDPTADAAD